MTDAIVKTDPQDRQDRPSPRRARPGLRANIEVRFVLRDPVRKEKDRPVHMADIEIPGPG